MDQFNLFGIPQHKKKKKKKKKKQLYFEKTRPLSAESLQGTLVYLYGLQS